MSSYVTRTTRTVRTFGGPDGATTETHTYSSDGSDFDRGMGINKNFGGMNINAGISNGRPEFSITKNVPEQSRRYQKGWGSSRGDRRDAAMKPPMKLEGKTYDEIKAQCLREGRLFEDPDFIAEDKSIFYSKAPPRPFEWKRPTEICDDPQLFVSGASRFDVKQGELGDCWLLAAVASLCQNQKFLARVVPEDQSFSEGYAGIFKFNFWQFGKWTEVIVDDRLPTYNNRLVFMHSVDSNEFWTPLVEKAYAKLVGSYEALKGGSTSEAMEDFTGGMTEMFDLKKSNPNLFKIMEKSFNRGSLMGCSIEGRPGVVEAELSNGLIMGHAYSVTCAKLMEINTGRRTGKIPMVRVRNPWGNEAEWNGAWSDKSPEWKFITDDERENVGLTFDADGEFWMSFQDWSSNFQKLEICHLGVDDLDDPLDREKGKHFEATMSEGSWIKRVNAGGCRNFLNTFWTNPQYRVEVTDTDDDDDDNGTLIIALMQKGRRKLRSEGLDLLTVGYVIYRISGDNNRPLDKRFFGTNQSCARSDNFINMREITSRHTLTPGHYCIVPSTFDPDQEGEFLMRIFSEKPNTTSEMDEETSMSDVQPGRTPISPRGLVVEIEEKGKTTRYISSAFSNAFGNFVPEVKSFFSSIFRIKDDDDDDDNDTQFSQVAVEEETCALVHEEMFVAKDVDHCDVEYIVPEESRPAYGAPPTVKDVVHNRVKVLPPQELTEDDRSQDDGMRAAFQKISGENMEIDAYELKDILNAAFQKAPGKIIVFSNTTFHGETTTQFKFDGFSSETCRSMVAMMDVDRSGCLGFHEFKKLWNDLRLWKSVFKKFDKDASGNFNSYEMRAAFHAIGFRVSNSTFNALVQRYSHSNGKIEFDDFIHCTVRLKHMFDIFRESDENRSGKAAFELDEFVQIAMYS